MFDNLKNVIEHLPGGEKIAATIGGVIGYFGGLTLLGVPVLSLEFLWRMIGALLLSAGGAASGVAGKRGMTHFLDWWGRRKRKKH